MSTEENSRTPQLRFPGFRGEWKEKKLREVANNEDNIRRPIAKTERQKGSFPYYGANGIQDYVGDYLFDGEYILVGEDGSVMTKDNTPVVHWASGKFWVNNHAHVLSQKDDISLKYVSYILSTIKISGLVTGIPPKLNQDNLNNILVPMPSNPDEQQKIAGLLSALDDLISAQGEKVEALKEKKKGLLQQMFPQNGETIPRLRFPGFSREWDVRTLGEIATKINRRNSKLEVTRVLTNSANEGIVDQSLYFDRNIAIKDNTANYYIVELEDFIYNPRISTAAPVGPISINKIGHGIISPLYTVFKIHTGCIAFFEQYFETTIWHPYLKSIANFGVRFDRMNITTEGFYNMPLLLPSIEEQQKIADCLKALDEQISAESAKLEALKDHKKSLMQQLFPNPSK